MSLKSFIQRGASPKTMAKLWSIFILSILSMDRSIQSVRGFCFLLLVLYTLLVIGYLLIRRGWKVSMNILIIPILFFVVMFSGFLYNVLRMADNGLSYMDRFISRMISENMASRNSEIEIPLRHTLSPDSLGESSFRSLVEAINKGLYVKSESEIEYVYYKTNCLPALFVKCENRIDGYEISFATFLRDQYGKNGISIFEMKDEHGENSYFYSHHFYCRALYLDLNEYRNYDCITLEYPEVKDPTYMDDRLPFFFRDVNFDGIKELVVNTRYGMSCFQKEDGVWIEMENLPFSELSCLSVFDFGKQTITLHNGNSKTIYGFINGKMQSLTDK